MTIDEENTSNHFVIFQWPNKYIWIMLVTFLASLYFTGYILLVARIIFYSSGILWSYGEIVHGANWFRKALGVIVLSILLLSAFKLLLKI